MKKSRYVAYVDTSTAETCCKEGHDTALEAIQHAAARILERKGKKS